MKKTFIALSVSAVAFYSCIASANNGVYVTGSVGSSIVRNYDSKVIDHDYADEYSPAYTGVDKFKDKSNGVFAGSIAVGYDFNDQFQIPFRAEINTTFRAKADGSTYSGTDEYLGDFSAKNKVRMNTFMLNGFYDFYNSSDFIPYVTAGIGISNLKSTLSASAPEYDLAGSKSKSTTNFAWGLGAGVKYKISSDLLVDAGYKYIDGGKLKHTDQYDDGYYRYETKASSHDLLVGLTYKF